MGTGRKHIKAPVLRVFLHDDALRPGGRSLRFSGDTDADFSRRGEICDALWETGLQQRVAGKTLSKRRMRRIRGKQRAAIVAMRRLNAAVAWAREGPPVGNEIIDGSSDDYGSESIAVLADLVAHPPRGDYHVTPEMPEWSDK